MSDYADEAATRALPCMCDQLSGSPRVGIDHWWDCPASHRHAVAAAIREAVLAAAIRDDHAEHAEREQAIREAVAREREACAALAVAVADTKWMRSSHDAYGACCEVTAAIRARIVPDEDDDAD